MTVRGAIYKVIVKFQSTALVALPWLLLGPLSDKAVAEDCHHIQPNPSADINFRTIMNCLLTVQFAELTPGKFQLSRAVRMPPGSMLSGSKLFSRSSVLMPGDLMPDDGKDSPTPSRESAEPYNDNVLVDVSDNDIVRNIKIVGSGRLRKDCCTSLVSIHGSNSIVEGVEVIDMSRANNHDIVGAGHAITTGIYFIGDSKSKGNVVTRASIHDVFRGVIFRNVLPVENPNRLENSEIFMSSCDAITFAGYGVSHGNSIHDSGFDCAQSPIPIGGAAVYAADNQNGAVVESNSIRAICGNGIDTVRSANFIIKGNDVRLTGRPFGTQYKSCGGGSPLSLVDDSRFYVERNYFSGIDIPPLGFSFDLFPAFRTDTLSAYSPLPRSVHTMITAQLLHLNQPVIGNRFTGNVFLAHCSNRSTCTGLGLYVGPGTGAFPNGAPGDYMPNTFEGNKTAGSDIGFFRCRTNTYTNRVSCGIDSASTSCSHNYINRSSTERSATSGANCYAN